METQATIITTKGTRKTSVARIRLLRGEGKIVINGKSVEDYFGGHTRQKFSVMHPINATGGLHDFDVIGTVNGGGPTGQADAISLGISRALSKLDEKKRLLLRKAGFLTRDSRMVERKKPGQPKARKRFQYSKR